jgi:DNA-directed RNA polymerase subunit RPC12/RpoP
MSAKQRIRYKCIECGNWTMADDLTGMVLEHRASPTQEALCPASRTVPKATYACERCGTKTTVLMASRRVSNHRARRATCPMSGAGAPVLAEVELLPPEQPNARRRKPGRKSNSVWTVSGGLPTLGKQR